MSVLVKHVPRSTVSSSLRHSGYAGDRHPESGRQRRAVVVAERVDGVVHRGNAFQDDDRIHIDAATRDRLELDVVAFGAAARLRSGRSRRPRRNGVEGRASDREEAAEDGGNERLVCGVGGLLRDAIGGDDAVARGGGGEASERVDSNIDLILCTAQLSS